MSVKVMLWYDVEDYVTPEADEALLELIDMMDELGIRSSLKVVGEKARVLQARGRRDILDKMAGHEICYHSKDHSRHPTVTEYCETMGFAEGARAFMDYEQPGYEWVRDITGQHPTSYGQAGASWAPQVFPVIRHWGFPHYLDDHNIIDLGGRAFWYGGALTLTRLRHVMRCEHKKGPEEVARAKAAFRAIVEGGVARAVYDYETPDERTVLVSIYYHPCEFSCEMFWDGVNFMHGRNPEGALMAAPVCGSEERARRIGNLREFLAYTLTFPEVEYITASQASAFETVRTLPIAPADMRAWAEGFTGDITFAPVHGAYLAPSELFTLCARALLGRHLTPELLYGPEADQPSELNGELLDVKALADAALNQYDTVFGYRQLKTLYVVGNQKLNPMDMLAAMASALRTGAASVLANPGARLAAADYVNPNDDYRNNWLFGPDLMIPGIVRHTKLQCWTLKPAVF